MLKLFKLLPLRSAAGRVTNLKTTTLHKCAAVPRQARIYGSKTFVSLNSRFESNEEEGKKELSGRKQTYGMIGDGHEVKLSRCQIFFPGVKTTCAGVKTCGVIGDGHEVFEVELWRLLDVDRAAAFRERRSYQFQRASWRFPHRNRHKAYSESVQSFARSSQKR